MSMYFFIHIGRSQLKSIFCEKTKSRDYNNPLCRPLKYREYCSRQGAAFKALIHIPTYLWYSFAQHKSGFIGIF